MSTPIKRHEALVQFSKEHHFGLMLGWKVRQGFRKNIDPSRMSEYLLAAFRAEVLPHFENEEVQLFVLLPQTDALRLQAEQEHVLIRELVKDISKNAEEKKLMAFADALDAHIRFEERTLFPHIEQQQSFEAYAKAMQEHAALLHADFDKSWDDHFWK